MKNPLTIICFFFTIIIANAQQFYFLGTYRQKESGVSYWCQNAGEYTLKEVKNYNEYETLKKEYYANHKNEWPYTNYLKADHAFIIYKINTNFKEFGCSYYSTGYAEANTIEEVQKIIQQRKAQYKFTDEQVLYTHTPKQQDSDKKVVEKNYGELSAKYTFVKTATTKAILVAFKNNSEDRAVVVSIYRNLKNFDELNPNSNTDKGEPQIVVLQPGEAANINLKTENFYIEIFERKADEPQDNTSWVDWIKEKIKNHIIIEGGYKQKGSTTCMCIRG